MHEAALHEPLAYHLTPEPYWRALPADEPYLPEGFEREGFVHLTHGLGEVIHVANRYYRHDPRPYLLLTIDLTRVPAPLRYDDPNHQFPHVYGPIPREAIVAIQRLARAADGSFCDLAPDGEHG